MSHIIHHLTHKTVVFLRHHKYDKINDLFVNAYTIHLCLRNECYKIHKVDDHDEIDRLYHQLFCVCSNLVACNIAILSGKSGGKYQNLSLVPKPHEY